MFPSRRITTSGGDVFRNEYSLEFDGSNDYVDCGNDSSLNWGDGDGTVACWFKTTDTGTSDIVMNGSYSTDGKGYVLLIDSNGKFQFAIDDNSGAGVKYVLSTTSANDGIWHHIAGVREGTNIRLYVDGVEDAASPTAIASYGSLDISDNLFFGAGTNQAGGSAGNFYQGNIDEVAIWNTSLTSNQIKTLYNNREPFNAKNIALSNLKGYWRMGDGVVDNHGAFDTDDNGIIGDESIPTTLGGEMIVDGDFALTGTQSASTTGTYWTTEANWTIADGKATFDDTDSGYYRLEQPSAKMNTAFATGVIYKMSCLISDVTETGNMAYFILTSDDGNEFDIISTARTAANGTHTFYFKANSSNNGDGFSIKVHTVSTSAWKITNISIKPVTGGNIGIMTNMTASDIVTDTH